MPRAIVACAGLHAFKEYLSLCVMVFLFCYLFPETNPYSLSKELGFAVFTGNDWLVLVLLFVTHGMAIVSFSFFTSTLFNNRTVATTIPIIFLFVLGPTSWIQAECDDARSNSGG